MPKNKVMNSGNYEYKAGQQMKSNMPESVTKGGDLRSRPTGGSQLANAKSKLMYKKGMK